jgi:hypothetical protein
LLSNSFIAGSDDLDGAIFGAHLGYNFQYGNLVLGPEIGINGFSRHAAMFRDVWPDQARASLVRHRRPTALAMLVMRFCLMALEVWPGAKCGQFPRER